MSLVFPFQIMYATRIIFFRLVVGFLFWILRPRLDPHNSKNQDRKKPTILDSHPNGLNFVGILTHRFLESRNLIKLLQFFLSDSQNLLGSK
jgi:hypothetical protein